LKQQLKIAFYGTPDFAVPSLQILLDSEFEICGVITAPDKNAGRGLKLQMTAIKEFALKNKLNIIQPLSLKSIDFMNVMHELNPDLQVVVAFRKLPTEVWSFPRLGTINLHASLLPQYRGAAPINWAIINGEKTTGTTTFSIDDKIDSGDMIMQKPIDIFPEDNAGSLHDKLSISGAKLLLESVRAISDNRVNPLKQDFSEPLKTAPKLSKEFCRINWNNKSVEIHNFIRGLSPYPGAYSFLNGKILKIFKTHIISLSNIYNSGSILTDNISYIHVKTGDGGLSLEELQIEGRKRMNVIDYLKGNKISENSVLL